jgi:hypothetical protein
MFSPFERDLVAWYAAHAPHPAVAFQLTAAAPAASKYTGSGLYLDLSVPTDCERIPTDLRSPIDGPQITSPEIPNGAGSVLFHKNGRITFIEVYTFDAELWKSPTEYRLDLP